MTTFDPQHAPTFTAEDEIRERSTATPKEMAEALADVHGLSSCFNALRITDNMTAMPHTELRMLDLELENIPDNDKAEYLQASAKCPELVGDAHKALFLRTVEPRYEPKVAQKLVKYWKKRHEVFGPVKCFMPLTLEGALRDDWDALSQGFGSLLPHKDKYGRAIIFKDLSRYDPSKCTSESMVRAMWYIHHIALGDPEVQRNGIVGLLYPKHARLHQVDPQIIREMVDVWTHLPMKGRAVHICHASPFSWIVLPVVKFFFGKRLRLRLNAHCGTEEEVLKELSSFGILRDVIPTELGGDVVLNTQEWLDNRRRIENFEKCNQKVGVEAIVVDNETRTVSSEGLQHSLLSKRVVGCKGDPRMNLAVKTMLDSPNLSRMDALFAGGFQFEGYDKSSSTDLNSFDEDGVSLAQRKNQLSRRIRKAKRKISSDPRSNKKDKTEQQRASSADPQHLPELPVNKPLATSFVLDEGKDVFSQKSTGIISDPHCGDSTPTTERKDYMPTSTPRGQDFPSGIQRKDSYDSFDDRINDLPSISDANG